MKKWHLVVIAVITTLVVLYLMLVSGQIKIVVEPSQTRAGGDFSVEVWDWVIWAKAVPGGGDDSPARRF